jgi:hypothetical protein
MRERERARATFVMRRRAPADAFPLFSAARPSFPAAGLTARAAHYENYAKLATPPWGSRHPAVVHANIVAHQRGAAALAAHAAAARVAGELPRSPPPSKRAQPPAQRINNVRRPASAVGEGPLLAPALECDADKPCECKRARASARAMRNVVGRGRGTARARVRATRPSAGRPQSIRACAPANPPSPAPLLPRAAPPQASCSTLTRRSCTQCECARGREEAGAGTAGCESAQRVV